MNKILFVGEAYGEQEDLIKYPFVGPAGWELLTLLEDSGLIELTQLDKQNAQNRWNSTGVLAAHYMREIWEAHRDNIALTNVFNLRPANNDITTLCTTKGGDRLDFPAIRSGKYIRREFASEIDRLYHDIKTYAPNITVALGATASWALLRNTGISRIRGTVTLSATAGVKVLPTYHPAAILRQYDLRPVTIIDLEKAKHESAFKEIRRPERRVYIEPTLSDLDWFYNYHISKARVISPDIETVSGQISCIGFGTSRETAIVVPFIDLRKESGSYWNTSEEEILAWKWVRKVLATPQPKIFQNGVYDVNYLWRIYGIPVTNFTEDTMLLHHALQPESQKGLGYLGSIYCNEAPWKLMGRGATKTIKRDE